MLFRPRRGEEFPTGRDAISRGYFPPGGVGGDEGEDGVHPAAQVVQAAALGGAGLDVGEEG